jgi:hypothetical protein
VSISYLGSFSTAQLVPVAASALSGVIAELQTQVTALASAAISFNPGGFAAQAALAASILAAIEAAVAAGVTSPTVSLQDEALLALNVKLTALLAFQTIMLRGGIQVLRYDGRADDFAPELENAMADLPGAQPSDDTHALVLVATTSEAAAALAAAFL